VPEIPLLDHQGKPLGELDSFLTLQGIMWLPTDPHSALNYRALAAPGQPIISNLFKDTVLRLSKNAVGGTITASVFLHLLQLKTHFPEHASVGKAVFIVSRGLEKLPPQDGRAVPMDRDNVHKFWTKFRPAAHLWGAAQWLHEIGFEPQAADELEPFGYMVIQIADRLLKAAAAVNLSFDPDPWRLPDAYPRKSFAFSIPPPKAEVIELLKEYRAPVRPK
jgi:hypothetical protein